MQLSRASELTQHACSRRGPGCRLEQNGNKCVLNDEDDTDRASGFLGLPDDSSPDHNRKTQYPIHRDTTSTAVARSTPSRSSRSTSSGWGVDWVPIFEALSADLSATKVPIYGPKCR